MIRCLCRGAGCRWRCTICPEEWRGFSEGEEGEEGDEKLCGEEGSCAKGSAGVQSGVYRGMVILERENDEVERDEEYAADAVEIEPGAAAPRWQRAGAIFGDVIGRRGEEFLPAENSGTISDAVAPALPVDSGASAPFPVANAAPASSTSGSRPAQFPEFSSPSPG